MYVTFLWQCGPEALFPETLFDLNMLHMCKGQQHVVLLQGSNVQRWTTQAWDVTDKHVVQCSQSSSKQTKRKALTAEWLLQPRGVLHSPEQLQ